MATGGIDHGLAGHPAGDAAVAHDRHASGSGAGWLFLVAAELIGASRGLGFLLIDGQNSGRADVIVLSIILLAVVGKTCDLILQKVETYLLRWTDTVKV